MLAVREFECSRRKEKTMSEYMETSKLLDKLDCLERDWLCDVDSLSNAVDVVGDIFTEVREAIYNTSTADVVSTKPAKLVVRTDFNNLIFSGFSVYGCSGCNEIVGGAVNFCPYCGRKLILEESGEDDAEIH